MKQEIHAATVWTAFFISVERDIQLHEKEQICRWVLTASKCCSGDNDLIKITGNRKITWQFEAFKFAEYIVY